MLHTPRLLESSPSSILLVCYPRLAPLLLQIMAYVLTSLGFGTFPFEVASVLAALSVMVYVPTAVQFARFYCKCCLQYYYTIIEYSLRRIVRLLCDASELISRRGRFCRVV